MSEISDNFHIGIPCKYAEEIIIPKFIWDYVEDEVVCVCRGGEIVKLELLLGHPEFGMYDSDMERECNAIFKISSSEYIKIWEKRLLHKIEGGWCKVKMHRISEGK